MRQFTVPQFIDVEDKIIGPITTRQFIIMLSGCILIAIFYRLFDFSLFVTAALFDFALTFIFSFAKINGRPFHYFVLNVIQTLKKPSLRVWNHVDVIDTKIDDKKDKDILEQSIGVVAKNKPSLSRLNELSLIVDTQGMYKGESVDDETNIQVVKKENIKL